MTQSGPTTQVDSPRLAAPVTGLLAQVPVRVDDELMGRAWGGLEIRPENLAAPEFADICVALSLSSTHTGRAPRTIKPFAVIVHETCSAFGWSEADYEGRAARALEVKRHVAVEQEFEQGALVASNPNLAQAFTAPTDPTSTVTLASGVRVSPSDAMCLLDEAIAYSTAMIGRGFIHATPFLIGKWKEAGLLTIDAPREAGFGVGTAFLKAFSAMTVDSESSPALALLAPLAGPLMASLEDYAPGVRTQMWSPKGNLVIAGNGYEGRNTSGAVEAAHASQWAYATDPIAVLASSPVTTPETFSDAWDRSRNIVTYRQDQQFAVLWGGLLHAAVKVATSTPAVA